MERTPQPRNRYNTPPPTARGRDFSNLVRPNPTIRPSEPQQLQPAVQQPAQQPVQPPYTAPNPLAAAQPQQTPSQIPTQATTWRKPLSTPGGPLPQQSWTPQVQPLPQTQPSAPLPQQPFHPQPPHTLQSPQSYRPTGLHRVAPVQPPEPTSFSAQAAHHEYNNELPDDDAAALDDASAPTAQSGILHGIRRTWRNWRSSASNYYAASPKRAAVMIVASFLVLSAIGWTIAAQSGSATDLLAKTPFGFLLIKQGHTKGDEIIVIEEKPTPEQIAAYQVPATHPRYISIPSISLFTRALALESQDQGITLPQNIYDVGWSTQSNTPNDPQGTQLYVGHTKGLSKTDAAFARLSELKPGNEIIIETGEGSKYTYVVMHTEKANVSSPNISRYYNSWVIGEPGLNLLTTSGIDPDQDNPLTNRYATFAVFCILKK